MSDTVYEGVAPPVHLRESMITVGSFLTEASGGAAAVILAILGLLSIAPPEMLAIATIVLGAAFALLGGVTVAHWLRIFSSAETSVPTEALTEGMAVASLCGAAGIVLGILAFVGTNATLLVPAAAIVFGGGLLAVSTTAAHVEAAAWYRQERREAAKVRSGILHRNETTGNGHAYVPFLAATPGPEAMIGLSGIVLGVLALAGFAPLTLSLVAMLIYGFAVVLKAGSMATAAHAAA